VYIATIYITREFCYNISISSFNSILVYTISYMEPNKWCTIESDPGVFSELIKMVGVNGIQVEELATLDKNDLANLGTIYGLVFLFKWNKKVQHRKVTIEQSEKDLFFAQQVIQDACASQAILSILLNIDNYPLPEELKQYKEFAKDLPYDMRGEAINNLTSLRNAHNSFHHPEPYVVEEEKDSRGKSKDVFHFISYVPFRGKVYELDGLQQGPVLVGIPKENWIDVAKEQIEKVMMEYSQNEIHFNLLAFIKDKKEIAETQIKICRIALTESARRLGLSADVVASEFSEYIKDVPTEKDKLEIYYKDMQAEVMKAEIMLAQEEEKRKRWHDENVRRKHNYIPFIYEMLKLLSKKGKLGTAIDKAKAKMNAKKKEAKAKKE
jgi:ubiquitin carboxyl-terminal hydrolase L5